MESAVFFDRDLSWLSFNERVLTEAATESVPLLERIRFLSIYSSNLDEFYRVRMPEILFHRQDENTYDKATAVIKEQQNYYGSILRDTILPALKNAGWHLLYNEPIPDEIADETGNYFFTRIAAFLQLVQLSGRQPFFPENNQLYLAAIVQHPVDGEQLYLVNVPTGSLPRFFKISRPEKTYIVFLEDIIREHLPSLFTGSVITDAFNIKITRDAALDMQDEYGEDVAEQMEEVIRQRDKGIASRLLYAPGIAVRHLYSIIEYLDIHEAATIEGGKYHNLKDLMDLPVSNPALSYRPWPAIREVAYQVKGEHLFKLIEDRDRIIHTPYQDYDTVLRFFNEAAIDNKVTEIFTTLYRVASDSKIAHALISAAKNGKKVTVLVELKARFDEANNIRWAKKMKAAGVKILYSSNKLKVHAKIALVKRHHTDLPYVGLLATGNLNESTARFYTDHILLTAHQPMLEEMYALFLFLNKRRKPEPEDEIPFKHLLVAQFNLQAAFLDLIDREIAHAQKGWPAAITIKLNNLEEEVLISRLYKASQAGVVIKLIVRSICRLIPGVPGLSENISVKRIVDRYLEHGRVFIFHNNGEDEVFLGSADWMNRNIYRRIEVCFPVYSEEARDELKQIIALQLADHTQAVALSSELKNVPFDPKEGIPSQEAIYEYLTQKNASV